MTAITTVLTKSSCVHATDSFITRPEFLISGIKQRKIVHRTRPKIVRVDKFRGAISYWGLADYESFDTYKYLRSQNLHNFSSPVDYAIYLANDLNTRISKLSQNYIGNKRDFGIGIHFSCWEEWNGILIPELFLISNFDDPAYTSLRVGGVGASRETYWTFSKGQIREPITGDPRLRAEVDICLPSGIPFVYNNGDPVLFNPIASGIFNAISKMKQRSGSSFASISIAQLRKICSECIKGISSIQAIAAGPNNRLVGGKIHNLSISKQGAYLSDSGV